MQTKLFLNRLFIEIYKIFPVDFPQKYRREEKSGPENDLFAFWPVFWISPPFTLFSPEKNV